MGSAGSESLHACSSARRTVVFPSNPAAVGACICLPTASARCHPGEEDARRLLRYQTTSYDLSDTPTVPEDLRTGGSAIHGVRFYDCTARLIRGDDHCTAPMARGQICGGVWGSADAAWGNREAPGAPPGTAFQLL